MLNFEMFSYPIECLKVTGTIYEVIDPQYYLHDKYENEP